MLVQGLENHRNASPIVLGISGFNDGITASIITFARLLHGKASTTLDSHMLPTYALTY